MKVEVVSTLKKGWDRTIEWDSALVMEVLGEGGGKLESVDQMIEAALSSSHALNYRTLARAMLDSGRDEPPHPLPWGERVSGLRAYLTAAGEKDSASQAPALLRMLDDVALGIPWEAVEAIVGEDGLRALLRRLKDEYLPLEREWAMEQNALPWPSFVEMALSSPLPPPSTLDLYDRKLTDIVLWLPMLAALRPRELELLAHEIRCISRTYGAVRTVVVEPVPEGREELSYVGRALAQALERGTVDEVPDYRSVLDWWDAVQDRLYGFGHVVVEKYGDVYDEAHAITESLEQGVVELVTAREPYAPYLELRGVEARGAMSEEMGSRLLRSVRSLLELRVRDLEPEDLRHLYMNPWWRFDPPRVRTFDAYLNTEREELLSGLSEEQASWVEGELAFVDALRRLASLKEGSIIEFFEALLDFVTTWSERPLEGEEGRAMEWGYVRKRLRSLITLARGLTRMVDDPQILDDSLLEFARQFLAVLPPPSGGLVDRLVDYNSGRALVRAIRSKKNESRVKLALRGMTRRAMRVPSFLAGVGDVLGREPEWHLPSTVYVPGLLVSLFSLADTVVLSAPVTQQGKVEELHPLLLMLEEDRDRSTGKGALKHPHLPGAPSVTTAPPLFGEEAPVAALAVALSEGQDREIALSATDANEMARCSLRYLLGRLLGEENLVGSDESLRKGRVIHYIMALAWHSVNRDGSGGKEGIEGWLAHWLGWWKRNLERKLEGQEVEQPPFLPADFEGNDWTAVYMPLDSLYDDLMWMEHLISIQWPKMVASLVFPSKEQIRSKLVEFKLEEVEPGPDRPFEFLEHWVEHRHAELVEQDPEEASKLEEKVARLASRVAELQEHGSFSLRTGEGTYSIKLVGRVDALQCISSDSDSNGDKRLAVVDYKYSKLPDNDTTHFKGQGAHYSIALISKGYSIQEVRFLYLKPRFSSDRKNEPVGIKSTFDLKPDGLGALVDVLDEFLSVVETTFSGGYRKDENETCAFCPVAPYCRLAREARR